MIMNRPVIAYHLLLTNYGFWLPNDPRGSWSAFVRAFELYRAAGSATKINSKHSVAGKPHDHQARRATKAALTRPPVVWNGRQAREVARGFADYATKNGRDVFAMAVMPDHALLVVGRSDLPIEKMANHLKARATSFLQTAGLHPFTGVKLKNGRHPTPWARHAWSVFLDTPAAVRSAIRYVEDNPVRAGLRRQRWSCVRRWEPDD